MKDLKISLQDLKTIILTRAMLDLSDPQATKKMNEL